LSRDNAEGIDLSGGHQKKAFLLGVVVLALIAGGVDAESNK
jgi:hypothetical protein